MRPVDKISDRTYEGKRSPSTRQQVSKALYIRNEHLITRFVLVE